MLVWLLVHFFCLKVQSVQYFYIYDWPSAVVNRWPTNYDHHRLSVLANFSLNCGIGDTVRPEAGHYHTHQYSIFRIFYYRLWESPHRTDDPEQASLFFIPFDLGMDSTTRKSDGALIKTNCPTLPVVVQYLQESKYFRRYHGSDHFVLHSINQMMIFYSDLNCMKLYDLCFNCTKLCIDAYSPGYYNVLDRNLHLTHKWTSIPFPSNYHMSNKMSIEPWNEISHAHRTHAVCYMGSLAITAKKQRQLRAAIAKECATWSSDCLLINLQSHDSHTSIPNAKEIIHQQIYAPNNKPQQQQQHHQYNQLSSLSVYSTAVFCLMPGGDFPTRKGFLDAMLSGCIPVTFQLAAAQEQWPWHWGGSDGGAAVAEALKCSVYIPRQQFMSDPEGAFRWLVQQSRNDSFVSEKRGAISRVAARFQYSVPSGRSWAELGSSTEGEEHRQFLMTSYDAVSVVLDRLLLRQLHHTSSRITNPNT